MKTLYPIFGLLDKSLLCWMYSVMPAPERQITDVGINHVMKMMYRIINVLHSLQLVLHSWIQKIKNKDSGMNKSDETNKQTKTGRNNKTKII